jgi:hypothetical protein
MVWESREAYPRVTPTFCIIKHYQARIALGCIFGKFSLRKRFFLKLIWHKDAFMAWNIVFSKNPLEA